MKHQIPLDNEQLKFCGLLWIRFSHGTKIHAKILRKNKTACGMQTFYSGIQHNEAASNVNPENLDGVCSTCREWMKKRFEIKP